MRILLALFLFMTLVHAELLKVPLSNGSLMIQPHNFRFSLMDTVGKTLAPAHHGAGASLNGSALSVVEQVDEQTFTLISGRGERVKLNILTQDGHIQFTMVPEKTSEETQLFVLQLGGMPVAYGLGDAGGWNDTLNLVQEEEKTYSMLHDGGKRRWVSSFVIFPQNQVAGVCWGGEQAVSLSKKNYKMTVSSPEVAVFSLFTGSMREIYASYQRVLKERGFPIVKPKKRLFELGWESWAALGWQTNAETMLKSITDFQAAGFPIRWAVSGSGYWEEGGTTTSFGKWGEKFPEAMSFKEKLHEADVKWMIGLRTNFVPDEGPFLPVTKKRDQNLEVDGFNGNPDSKTALEKNYFLKERDETPWKKHSDCFPIVPCYLVDGANSEAVEWYAGLYQKWQVDGIKEDTMMRIGKRRTDIFNHPIARIAQDEALVMARCGSYTAPGTLLRINDTVVPELTKRIPINYLSYAASGAPNVYSDTVGFKKMKGYSEMVVRHAWLQALTAGMAIGESCAHWTEKQQEVFKRPFNFHYEIVPILYEAALDSYKTGYPSTMTPLGIAFPDDPQATGTLQWMIGDSLLCCPLLKDYQTGKLDVYLPEGTWYDYDTGEKYEGPKLLKGFAMPVTKTPVFVGGDGILKKRELGSELLKIVTYGNE